MKKLKPLFPIVVIIICLLNIWDNSNFDNIPTLLISLLGIIGSLCFFAKVNLFKPIMYLWIITQLIVIPSFWDVTHLFSLKFGMHLQLKNGVETGLLLNIVPFLYFAPLTVTFLSTLVDEEIKITGFRSENNFGDIFPVNGRIIKTINLADEKDWLLVELDQTFKYLENEIKWVLLKAKDQTSLKKSIKKQLSFLRLVIDIKELKDQGNDKDKFPFVDWVMVEI